MMKKLLIAFVLLIFATTSCKKSDRLTAENVPATITFTGGIATDGCGFLIKIDDSSASYHADNLPVDFQKDKLPVIVSYQLLNTKYSCGLLSDNISVIKIDAVKQR